ncbi:MAG: YncE family protein [Clostridium sp.]|nr:YncE family protein [Clostridium sp.]
MSYIVVCNTGSDSLSRINTYNLKVENLYLSNGDTPFGPHGLALYKNNIITANNYNNSISIIDSESFKEVKNLYIGAHPNDISINDETVYVTCGESDSLIAYDLISEGIDFEIPTGRFPHDIILYKEKNILFVSNMGDDSISVVEIEKNREIKKIIVENTPLKITVSNNRKYLYVCMSYLGYDQDGYVGIISLDSLQLVDKIKVGYSPVDLFEENGYLYISNLCGGSISVVNLAVMREENRIETGGMPRGIIKVENMIYSGDYQNGIVNIIDLKENKIKAITVGREPNAMAFIET